MSIKNMTIEKRKVYLDQLMREYEESKPEIGDSVSYYANFENYLRTAKVVDTLKEGSDKEGGYLVPNEYHDKLIQKLEDELVIRKLATVFTADYNISIPGVSKHGEADWISEGVPYPESDEEFNGIELGAHKNGCITIVTDELLEDSAFSIEDYPFGFQIAGVVLNDSVTREAISKDQIRKFLKFVHDDVVYCKYYEVVYILFHTGLRISEFCGLTLKDIDLEYNTLNIDHQLQRTADMRYIIETIKTDAGTRKIPITNDVADMFRAIIENREAPSVEKVIDGYTGFLFYDENDMPLVAMHWQHRFNNMVGRYNDIYRVQMPNITPHVCRHTYCSNQAKAGMNPKTLQYLMGHSDISVTMNVYTHYSFDDAVEELKRLEEFRKVQTEVEKKNEKPMSQKQFKVV